MSATFTAKKALRVIICHYSIIYELMLFKQTVPQPGHTSETYGIQTSPQPQETESPKSSRCPF